MLPGYTPGLRAPRGSLQPWLWPAAGPSLLVLGRPPPQLVSPLCLVRPRLPGAVGPCRDQTRARSLMALGTSGRNQNKHWFCTIGKALYVPVSLLNWWEGRLEGWASSTQTGRPGVVGVQHSLQVRLGSAPRPVLPEQGRSPACRHTYPSGTGRGSPSHPAGRAQAGASVRCRSGHKAMGLLWGILQGFTKST